MGSDAEHSDGRAIKRARPGRSFRLGLALAAVASLLVAAGAGACNLASSQPSATTIAAEPLTPGDVATRLRTIEPGFTLVATSDDRDMTGIFPSLTFRAQTAVSAGAGATLGVILVYRTPAERQAAEPHFGPMSIQGPSGLANWDGIVHSEWVGVDNVLVEVVMPGGSFGGRSPTPSELSYPDLVREALSSPPIAAAT
jgi:hypothetical protein